MIRKISNSILIIILLVATLAPSKVYAGDYGVGRTRSCSASGAVEGLDFNPTSGGKDVQFDLTNPVCLTVIVASYALVKAAITNMNSECGNPGAVRVTPSPISDAIDMTKAAIKCGSNPETNESCCVALNIAEYSFGAAMVALGIIYGVAKDVYNNTFVCGAQWMKANPSEYNFSAADYKQTVQLKIDGWVRDGSAKLDQSCLKANGTTVYSGARSDCQIYREWFYDGAEYEDNPYSGSVCRDPTRAKVNGQYPPQRYYLKGTTAGNYNCKKYLVVPGQSVPAGTDLSAMKGAYECCLNRSKNYMCIDYKNTNVADNPPSQIQRTPTFCKANENCTMMRPGYTDPVTNVDYVQVQNGGIWFTVQSQGGDSGLICAQSYSLCPYNFSVGGGSDGCDYYRDGKWSDSRNSWVMIDDQKIEDANCGTDSEIRNPDCTFNAKAGKCRNYCQYLTNCAETSSEDYVYESSLGSPYFSQACVDFVGDSRNNTGFNTGVIMGKQNHFTAPIAQCIKESLENVFYNRAGHSKCLNYGEAPDSDGVCPGGLYTMNGNLPYKKGEKVKDNSFFETLQKTMSLAIKMALTLAVIFYGVNLLLWKVSLGDKKSILVFLFKIALVMYFAAGNAWQTVFFRGFYDSSMVLANMLFKIETQVDEKQRDGCQFGKVSLPDGTQIDSGISYPAGKEYLAIWDTIDCKMMRYLGFGPQMSNANIASMVIACYFAGPIGIYFAMSVMIFGFFLVSLGIRALHIFISSAAAIIMLVFVSPITITCGMFEKTKGIFNGWLSKLISYCLQPMILFAYVAVFITVMDKTLIGSATFIGSSPNKVMSCAPICVDALGALVPYDGDQAPACDQQGQKTINPLDDSVACLLNFNSFGQWHAFEIIGVALPVVTNLFGENVKQRMLTILTGALVMYLLYAFMDEIPSVIEALVGGGLAANRAEALSMMKQAVGMTSAIATRLGRAGAKVAGSVGSTVSSEFGKGKEESVAEAEDKKSGDDQSGSRSESKGEDSTDSKSDSSGEDSSSDKNNSSGDSTSSGEEKKEE